VRREPDFFGDRELELVYIAKRLKEALKLEEFLTSSGVDYLVEPDRYRGGVLFVSERTGAFFYVDPAASEATRGLMIGAGFHPWDED
jgi:hypothetical protein